MFDRARTLNKTEDPAERQKLAAELLAAGDLVGLMQSDPEEWFSGSAEGELGAEDIESLLAQREQARANGDYAAADKIRDDLAERGITIEDSASGTRWRRS
jgi:cysteinyl-tRNA synthetase